MASPTNALDLSLSKILKTATVDRWFQKSRKLKYGWWKNEKSNSNWCAPADERKFRRNLAKQVVFEFISNLELFSFFMEKRVRIFLSEIVITKIFSNELIEIGRNYEQ